MTIYNLRTDVSTSTSVTIDAEDMLYENETSMLYEDSTTMAFNYRTRSATVLQSNPADYDLIADLNRTSVLIDDEIMTFENGGMMTYENLVGMTLNYQISQAEILHARI